MELTDKKIEILKKVKTLQEPHQALLAENLGVDPSTISYHVDKLEENDFLHRTQGGANNFLALTEKGKNRMLESMIEDPPGYSNTPMVEENEQSEIDHIRLHDFKIVAEISDNSPPTDRWFETWAEHEEKEFKDVDGGYITYYSGFKIRFTHDKVMIFLGTWEGEDIEKIKDRAMKKASAVLDKLEYTPVELDPQTITPKFEIAQQEIALEKDLLATFLDNNQGIDIKEVYVEAPDGKRRIHIDKSTGEPELEFTHKELAEDDADFWKKEVLQELAENKDEWKKLFSREKNGQLDGIEASMDKLIQLKIIETLDGIGQGQKKEEENNLGVEKHTPRYAREATKEKSTSQRGDGSEHRASKLRRLENSMRERMNRIKSRNKGEWEDILE